MKKELTHFNIGDSYGGNQDWFSSFMMRLGGCAAETACDCSIYFSRELGMKSLYPFDDFMITKEDYVKFSDIMGPYLRPRHRGIDTLDIYIDGYSKYLRDTGASGLTLTGFDGHHTYAEAATALRNQIDNGFPVPCLTLRHQDERFKEYYWHWYIINGYKERVMLDESMNTSGAPKISVKCVTYSEYEWVDFQKLWETGHDDRGGMILFGLTD
jgi:hypothetical protein